MTTNGGMANGGHLGSAILDFSIFSEPLKIAKIDQKVTENNKRT